MHLYIFQAGMKLEKSVELRISEGFLIKRALEVFRLLDLWNYYGRRALKYVEMRNNN